MAVQRRPGHPLPAAAPQLWASITVRLETPVTPHTSSPWPSTAQEGEKNSSTHDAAAHTASLPRLTLLPKGWAGPDHVPPAAGG